MGNPNTVARLRALMPPRSAYFTAISIAPVANHQTNNATRAADQGLISRRVSNARMLVARAYLQGS